MRNKVIVFVLSAMIFVISFASAGIFIEPLKEVYNQGEILSIKTNLVYPSSLSGHYIAELSCGLNTTIPIFNQFINLNANVEKHFEITTELTDNRIRNYTGNCLVKTNFNGEIVSSSSYRLSNLVELDTELAFDELKPGALISVSGTAFKESELPFNGYVELFIPTLNLYKSGTIQNGILNLSISLPLDAKSGKHNLSLKVHDSDYVGKDMNNGVQDYTLKVFQILKSIEIIAERENINPTEEFVFIIDARDQAGDPMPGQVSILVSEPNGLPFIKKVIKQGETQKIPFSLNNTPGYWTLEVNLGEVTKRKLFYLAEVPKIQTSLINDTLIVTNIGNALYEGPLEITIGSHVEIKQLKIAVGETEKFKIRAPEGTYSISILDEGETKPLGNTFLTGNAIKITDFKEDVLSTVSNPLIWWLVAILFVAIIVLVRIKAHLQNKPPTPSSTTSNSKNLGSWRVKLPENDNESISKIENKPIEPVNVKSLNPYSSLRQNSDSLNKNYTSNKSNNHVPAINKIKDGVKPALSYAPGANPFIGTHEGIRERAVAIAVKAVSNNSPYVMQTINSTLSIAQETGAKIYVDGESKIVLFSPRLTKTKDNEILAVNTARRMEALFSEHNRLHNDKISFGIGINDGEIISETEKGKFQFTSTGNLISSCKRISQSAVMKLLLSDSVRRKVMNTIKTEQSGSTGLWEITRVVDRSSKANFISEFNKRNK